uniref:Uncharacterized protein n=1 Tax=Alexandrium monilatum TaxID=311494 RepID=A0A7S4VGA0_9DINO
MPPGITWREEDTDSEHGSGAGDSTPSSGRRTPELHAARIEDGRALSPEEFGRMQDEFLALKMHNQELLDERRRLQSAAQSVSGSPAPNRGSAAGASALTAAGAAAFGRSLSTQMTGSTGVMSAFGVRGVTSWQPAWAKNGASNSGADGAAAAVGADEGGALDEREALRVEAELLRSRIRATVEEVEEFRTVAGDAQQVVAAAEQAARERTLVLPPAGELRQKVAEGLARGGGEFEFIQTLNDEQILQIGGMVLALVTDQRQASSGPEGQDFVPPAPEESDEDRLLLQRKIEAQQEELDRLLEHFHQQQEHIIRLKDQLSGKGDPEKKKQVKEKLQHVERQAEGLTRQLETSEQGLQQSQELRTQLRALAMQAVQRDQVIAEMRSMFELQAAEVAVLRDRLLHSLEDLAGRAGRHAERPWGAQVAVQAAAVPALSTEGSGSHAAVGSTAVPNQATAAATHPARASVITVAPAEMSDVAAQVELSDDGTVAALAESVQLRTEIDDIHVEKALLEKRTAKQLQELRALVEPARVPGRRELGQPAAAAEASGAVAAPAAGAARTGGGAAVPAAGSGTGAAGGGLLVAAAEGAQCRPVVYHDISSDGEGKPERHRRPLPDPDAGVSSDDEEGPEYSAGMLYVQQVADLEQRNDGLRQELEDLHEAERGLRAEIKEKTDLIARLMQKANFPQPSSAAAHGQERAFWRTRQSKRWSHSDEEFRDLERIIEETREDNLRLRNDIQIMAEEFRKVISVVGPGLPKKA